MLPRIWLGIASVVALVCVAPSSMAQDAGADSGGQQEAGTDGGGQDGGTPTATPGAIIAHYCGDAAMRCMVTPIEFHHSQNLADWLPDWDTGWIPKNSDVQVRFALQIPNETTVDMAGRFRAQWPEAITLDTPGRRFAGLLKFNYGLITKAEFGIHTVIAGKHLNWEHDIPYVPNIDFELKGAMSFDTWAYDPERVVAAAATDKVNLFDVNLASLVGLPSWLQAGVAVNLKGELRATYYTEEMIIDEAVTSITAKGGSTVGNFLGGPFVEYTVHPKGHLKFDGIIHLMPAIYAQASYAGIKKRIEVPVYDYKINITDMLNYDTAQTVDFKPVIVHVPLPDLEPFGKQVIDFGDVVVGSQGKAKLTLTNDGEAQAMAVGELDPTDPQGVYFKLGSTNVYVDPDGATNDMTIRFRPKKEGKFETMLTVNTNDPDLPQQTVLLRGNGVPQDVPDYPEYDGGADDQDGGTSGGDFSPNAGDDGGCGCRVAGEQRSWGTGAGVWFGLLALGLWTARRRAVQRQKNH